MTQLYGIIEARNNLVHVGLHAECVIEMKKMTGKPEVDFDLVMVAKSGGIYEIGRKASYVL